MRLAFLGRFYGLHANLSKFSIADMLRSVFNTSHGDRDKSDLIVSRLEENVQGKIYCVRRDNSERLCIV